VAGTPLSGVLHTDQADRQTGRVAVNSIAVSIESNCSRARCQTSIVYGGGLCFVVDDTISFAARKQIFLSEQCCDLRDHESVPGSVIVKPTTRIDQETVATVSKEIQTVRSTLIPG